VLEVDSGARRGGGMNGLTVIIPSKTRSNVDSCVAHVARHEPNAKVLIIDDGIDWSGERGNALRNGMRDVRVIPGVKPFIFARNVNLGIRMAGEDDVVLLNDDALLQDPGGFSLLQLELERHPGIGMIGAVTNFTGYLEQRKRTIGGQQVGLRPVQRFAFLCVCIPRRTINRVGLLDERYTTYGGEDIDYCRQVREAGLQCAVHDACYVDHGSLNPTFRKSPSAPGDSARGLIIYGQKWGDLR